MTGQFWRLHGHALAFSDRAASWPLLPLLSNLPSVPPTELPAMRDPAASSSRHTVLRDLPLAARLVLAVFLISVGLGYFSALVNLHFQEASAGEGLPTKDNVVNSYHGKQNHSQLVRLLITSD